VSGQSAGGTDRYSVETDGVINSIEVTISVEGEDEHLADLIHSDLTSRADELNQIVEGGVHPHATIPPSRVDWEGWLNGEYDRNGRSVEPGTDHDGGDD